MNDMPVPVLKLGTEDTPSVQPAAPTQAASAAVQSAPAAQAAPVAPAAQADPALSLDALSPEERRAVLDFVDKIDVEDSRVVLSYGAGAQQQISTFSDKVLENVRTKDTGEVGDMLAKLVAEIKGFDVQEEKKGGLFGWFKNTSSGVTQLKAKYDKVEVNVDVIVSALKGHQEQLLKDITMLDEMYALNQQYFRELTLYIVAGEERLKKLREVELPPLLAHARETGDAADAQRANDFAAMIDRFEKKLHDLKLSRMVSIQMGPQVRLMQNNDTILTEKIQSTIVNTIPLWKSQMVIALGMAHAEGALKAQQAVTDVTNDLLKKNAEMLKTGTIETAKAAERGIIDIETVRAANIALIDTITEVQRIQTEGANARAQAQQELGRLEKELKEKLLETR